MQTKDWLTPDWIRRLEALRLSIGWVRSGNRIGGRFAINRKGMSVEFSDHAPYTPGDDIRDIDWNLYARLDRLYVKTYREEVALSVELIVDCSRSMGFPGDVKFERARRLAVYLAYVALSGGHHARLHSLSLPLREPSLWCMRMRDIFQMIEFASRMRVAGDLEWLSWMRQSTSAFRIRGGQAVVITDGMVRLPDLFYALHVLRKRHVDVRLIQIITPEELRPSRWIRGGSLVDAETREIRYLNPGDEQLDRAVRDHNALLAEHCSRNGIAFAEYCTKTPLEDFVTRTLPQCGFLG